MKRIQRIKPCSVGGVTIRTGKRGTRHRWKESTDGKCIHCHRSKREVIGEKPLDDVAGRLAKMKFEVN